MKKQSKDLDARTDTQPWKITKTSALTGITRTIPIPMTGNQLARYVLNIEHIQDIFPELSVDQREYLISGITKEEWDDAFKEEDE